MSKKQLKTECVLIRLTKDDKKRMRRLCKQKQVSYSEFIREQIRVAENHLPGSGHLDPM